MCIDIKLNGDVFAHLDIELFDAVLAENTEHTFFGILTWHFDNIFL